MFALVRWCAEPITQACRLKIKVTVKGHEFEPWISCSLHMSWTLWKIFIKFGSNVRLSEMMCRTHNSTMQTQGQGHNWMPPVWALNFEAAPLSFCGGVYSCPSDCFVLSRTVNILATNKLVKLWMLWTTGLRMLKIKWQGFAGLPIKYFSLYVVCLYFRDKGIPIQNGLIDARFLLDSPPPTHHPYLPTQPGPPLTFPAHLGPSLYHPLFSYHHPPHMSPRMRDMSPTNSECSSPSPSPMPLPRSPHVLQNVRPHLPAQQTDSSSDDSDKGKYGGY